MAYRFEAGEPAAEGLRRIAAEQLGRARAELDDDALDLHATVHQVRKRCKKVRGLLRLVRPALADGTYGAENRALRDTARLLSDLRDAEVMRATVDALLEARRDAREREAFEAMRAELRRRRDAAAGAADGTGTMAEVARRLEAARERAAGWRLDEGGAGALAGGLRRTYRRGRRAMREALARPSPGRFHAWRKRAKYGMYHLRLLRGAWPGPMDAWEREQDALGARLGEDHDLAVLESRLDGLPARDEGRALLRDLAASRRAALQREARALGLRLYADKPKAHARRLARWVDAWTQETP